MFHDGGDSGWFVWWPRLSIFGGLPGSNAPLMPEDQQPAPPDQQQAPGQQQRPVEPAPDDEAVQSRASGRTRGRHSPKGTQAVRTQPHPADNKSPQDLEQGA